ncbi:hypothetical protein BS17DRAFT_769681 [Gyrodon lividus]|nr:hypothetical protein BS17DRAFT_769681 [Gyrodon lividus]
MTWPSAQGLARRHFLEPLALVSQSPKLRKRGLNTALYWLGAGARDIISDVYDPRYEHVRTNKHDQRSALVRSGKKVHSTTAMIHEKGAFCGLYCAWTGQFPLGSITIEYRWTNADDPYPSRPPQNQNQSHDLSPGALGEKEAMTYEGRSADVTGFKRASKVPAC